MILQQHIYNQKEYPLKSDLDVGSVTEFEYEGPEVSVTPKLKHKSKSKSTQKSEFFGKKSKTQERFMNMMKKRSHTH